MNTCKAVLRILNPRGYYPENSFLSKDASFISDQRRRLVFSVVRSLPEDQQYYNSETAWALVSEIRLWSSIILAIPKDSGLYIISPNNYPISLDETDFVDMSFNTNDFLTAINKFINEKIEGLNFNEKIDYNFNSTNFDKSVQKIIYNNINCDNHILIRGLSNLIKARLLIKANAYHFMEEAILLVYLAIESALALIRNQLQKEGTKTPSIQDIFDRISNKYAHGLDVSEFFEECNENRVILVHPNNKYLITGIPDLAADDFFDTCKTIEEFYSDLLIKGI